MTGILYISYSGMTEPLGQSQVLAYLERLAKQFDVHLISFEKPVTKDDGGVLATVQKRMADAGITWHPLRYHRRPSLAATAWDIAQGIRLGTELVRRHGLQLVHARSYVPSMMAVSIKKRLGIPYLFDMRGFWVDERVDAGLWRANGAMFRFAKRMEQRFLTNADAVVSLTHAAAEELGRFPYLQTAPPPIHIIPTCADLARFTPAPAPPADPFVLGYVGTVGNWYMFDETLECFKTLRRRLAGARLLVINRGEHDRVRALAAERGIDPGDISIVASSHADMPDHIRAMSAGILMARPAYSHIARAPTRLAEFLGCGIPCLANDGVGDVSRILENSNSGIVIRAFDAESRERAVNDLVALARSPDIAGRCAATAEAYFSVEAGAARYAEIYRTLGVTARA